MLLYQNVHKGLRLAFAESLQRLGNVELTDPTTVHELLLQVEEIIELTNAHAWVEEQYFHPALEARKPGCTEAMEADHHIIDAVNQSIAEALNQLKNNPTEQSLDLFYRKYTVFVARHLLHFEDEEAQLEPLFTQYFTAEELMDIRRNIVQNLSILKFRSFLKYILPAIRPAQRSQLIERIRESRTKEELELLQSVF